MSVNYNDLEWHTWHGGECPVHPKTVVAAIWRYDAAGVVAEDLSLRGLIRLAGEFQKSCWQNSGLEKTSEIVAFCVIKEYVEPREWWLTIGRQYRFVHNTEDEAKEYQSCNETVEIVHVREVQE